MTGQLRTTLHTRAHELERWDVDLDTIVRAGDRLVRRRRIGVAGAGLAVAVALVTVTVVHPRDTPSPGSGIATQQGSPEQVHTKYYDVPQAPDGFHVVGSLPDVAAITRNGTAYDLSRDTDTGLPQADITEVLLVQYNEDAANAFEKSRDPGLGAEIRYHGRTFFHNTTWSPEVDSVQYRRADGRWLRLQYPKQYHFRTADMVAYLDAVQVKAGATPIANGGAPRG